MQINALSMSPHEEGTILESYGGQSLRTIDYTTWSERQASLVQLKDKLELTGRI